jgi:hypothetical protein
MNPRKFIESSAVAAGAAMIRPWNDVLVQDTSLVVFRAEIV